MYVEIILKKRQFIFLLLILILTGTASVLYSQVLIPVPFVSIVTETHQSEPAEVECRLFQKSYPFARFSIERDSDHNDWILTVRSFGNVIKLYRAGGRYLTAAQYQNKQQYRRVLYFYGRQTPDPKTFARDQIERIRVYCSEEQRGISPVESTALFSAIYDGESYTAVVDHLRTVEFLGRKTHVHQCIIEPLRRVENRIWLLTKTEPEVAQFVSRLLSADSFSWRSIRDVEARSFHSYGVALDILPVHWERKILYWSYERGKSADTWMKIPLSARWSPPASVIEAFEDEGFIWGGRWIVWDNMHFEYHPELLSSDCSMVNFPENY
jgi:hypothetical protein